jgi:hypothetical protein
VPAHRDNMCVREINGKISLVARPRLQFSGQTRVTAKLQPRPENTQ